MLREKAPQPSLAQGAGKGPSDGGSLPPADALASTEWVLDTLLLLAALHVLFQAAATFSCLFLVLPLSFFFLEIHSRGSPASEEKHQPDASAGRRAGERPRDKGLLPGDVLQCLRGILDVLGSLVAVYFLIRTGLVVCPLVFILPLVWVLADPARSCGGAGERPDVAGDAAARATSRRRGAGVDAGSTLHWLVQITLFLALGQCLSCAGILEATIQSRAALLFFGPMVLVLSDALVTFSHVVPALLVFSMSVLAASLLYAGFPRLRALLPRSPPPGR
ncbi:unnamed protein product [Natator depressus]